MHVVHQYNQIHQTPQKEVVPRTIFFAGKAAPGYAMAKLIIKLITSVAHLVNNDPATRDKLRVYFLPNYSVSLAQRIFPASDLSEQIATAGMEASGTGNMKFALNGALTIGTLDGANVEMRDEMGEENIFIFGLKAHQVEELRNGDYNPMDIYHRNADLKRVIDMIGTGFFCPEQPDLFQPIVDSLLHRGDYYCLLADFESYISCQQTVSETYKDQQRWTRMSILNVANSGKFSTDRSIQQYADEIWGVKPVPIDMEA
jgi:starch phosphorylase